MRAPNCFTARTLFQPLPLFLAVRYLRVKRKNRFAAFVSLASVAGIALGVAILLIVLSVMNGFERQVAARILGMTAHATLLSRYGLMEDWEQIAERARGAPAVLAAEPFVRGAGMLNHRGKVRGIVLYGVPPASESRVSDLQQYLGEVPLTALGGDADPAAIFVGDTLAAELALRPGDVLTLIAPRWDDAQKLGLPRYVRLRVAGTFHAGMHEFDSAFGIVSLGTAARIFELGQAVSGLRVRFEDATRAPALAASLVAHVGDDVAAIDWTQFHRNFFLALKSQKRILFVLLALIIAVAAFNIVASMVMLVKEKNRDIAILRTIGLAPRGVLTAFLVQGVLIAAIGIGAGLALGVAGAEHANAAMNLVEEFFGVRFIKPDVYYIDYLPTEIRLADIIGIASATFAICLVAAGFPAWQASRIAPVEALRYD
jgi:lipoprotein-releasing system permease protein